ncbi:sn-glycerol-3-phosphate ABC transporter ATP-binding protein UgpC [candidate division KSB1 bacterium]|nr:sn-glycerol-3-phosphate ABC transporter ATP-binding protein UgpC [candidate division KSB1 bacterium]
MASVELKNITKIFDNKVTAINNVSLTIEDKEFLVLVGPSGCGKSTLLRMIAGLEEATTGDIYIDGKKVNDVHPKDRDISMVFQNYALYPHMSVYDNMAFGLKLRKTPKDEIKKRVQQAAEILHIQEYLDRKPKALSGGQRQRVAVGRAIVRQPKVFLFDEPLSNLDAKLRVQMRIEINRLYNQLQTTMVYVTHDQIEAMTMGSKIVVLKDGVIQQMDSPLDLYNNPANKFVAGFIGSPAMNFFTGKLIANGDVRFKSDLFDFSLHPKIAEVLKDYYSKKIVLGVRPEDIVDVANVNNVPLCSPQRITVNVTEPIGNEIFIYFSNEQENYCMRMPPHRLYQVGDNMDIAFNTDKLYCFDIDSEQRIR